MLNTLLEELRRQCIENSALDVEVLTSVDNKEKSTGRKRQELLEAATGKYIIFIDDDE